MTDDDFPITIYHNPACGTSRNALAMIHAAGYEPTVVDYLQSGWSRVLLEALLADMEARPRDVLREKGTPAAAMGLMDPEVDDETLIQAMLVEPVLVNRPIVATPKGVKLCRPSEAVLSLLERQPTRFTKEDGEVVQIPPAPLALGARRPSRTNRSGRPERGTSGQSSILGTSPPQVLQLNPIAGGPRAHPPPNPIHCALAGHLAQ